MLDKNDLLLNLPPLFGDRHKGKTRPIATGEAPRQWGTKKKVIQTVSYTIPIDYATLSPGIVRHLKKLGITHVREVARPTTDSPLFKPVVFYAAPLLNSIEYHWLELPIGYITRLDDPASFWRIVELTGTKLLIFGALSGVGMYRQDQAGLHRITYSNYTE